MGVGFVKRVWSYGGGTFVKVPPRPLKTFKLGAALVVVG